MHFPFDNVTSKVPHTIKSTTSIISILTGVQKIAELRQFKIIHNEKLNEAEHRTLRLDIAFFAFAALVATLYMAGYFYDPPTTAPPACGSLRKLASNLFLLFGNVPDFVCACSCPLHHLLSWVSQMVFWQHRFNISAFRYSHDSYSELPLRPIERHSRPFRTQWCCSFLSSKKCQRLLFFEIETSIPFCAFTIFRKCFHIWTQENVLKRLTKVLLIAWHVLNLSKSAKHQDEAFFC